MSEATEPITREDAEEDVALLQIFGAIVTHNVDSLKFTTDLLIDGLEKERNAMAKVFVQLYEALDSIDPMIQSVYVERLLDVHAYSYKRAVDFMEAQPMRGGDG